MTDAPDAAARPFAWWAGGAIARLIWTTLSAVLGALLAGARPTDGQLELFTVLVVGLGMGIDIAALYAWMFTDMRVFVRWLRTRLWRREPTSHPGYL